MRLPLLGTRRADDTQKEKPNIEKIKHESVKDQNKGATFGKDEFERMECKQVSEIENNRSASD